ncbi:hypothetical protein FRB94_014055 [Tulasnella sp. JGI-2019a]|nr:hypothetical protein FRB94_014055 [Tulasnella sp. JGI-2019a]
MFSTPSSSQNPGNNLDSLASPVSSDLPDYTLQLDTLSLSLCGTSPAYDAAHLPLYSTQIPPDEVFLCGSSEAAPSIRPHAPPLQLHVFKSRSPNMVLTVNAKQASITTFPAFGRGGMIDADLQVNDILRPGDSLQLIIEGFATARTIRICSYSTTRVLYHTQQLFEATNAAQASSSRVSTTYPISFQLPTAIENPRIPLPPSFYFRRPHIEANIRYRIRIIWAKKGLLRTDEELETVFFHFPRNRQRSPLPPSWWSSCLTASSAASKSPYAYSPRGSMNEWTTIPLNLLNAAAKPQLMLVLPQLLSYRASSRIAIKIIALSPTLAASNLVLDDVHVELVKTTTIMIKEKEYVEEEILGTASFCKRDDWMPPSSEVVGGMVVRTVHGCVEGGRPRGEMAWNVPGLMQVQYAIRVSFSPLADPRAINRDRQQCQPIELTTDCTHDFDADEAWVHVPAMGLGERIR